MTRQELMRLSFSPSAYLGLSGLANHFEHRVGYLGGNQGGWRGTSPSPVSREMEFGRTAPDTDLGPNKSFWKVFDD